LHRSFAVAIMGRRGQVGNHNSVVTERETSIAPQAAWGAIPLALSKGHPWSRKNSVRCGIVGWAKRQRAHHPSERRRRTSTHEISRRAFADNHQLLKRDEIRLNRHRALGLRLSMILLGKPLHTFPDHASSAPSRLHPTIARALHRSAASRQRSHPPARSPPAREGPR